MSFKKLKKKEFIDLFTLAEIDEHFADILEDFELFYYNNASNQSTIEKNLKRKKIAQPLLAKKKINKRGKVQRN
jgi:hypothetical protein